MCDPRSWNVLASLLLTALPITWFDSMVLSFHGIHNLPETCLLLGSLICYLLLVAGADPCKYCTLTNSYPQFLVAEEYITHWSKATSPLSPTPISPGSFGSVLSQIFMALILASQIRRFHSSQKLRRIYIRLTGENGSTVPY